MSMAKYRLNDENVLHMLEDLNMQTSQLLDSIELEDNKKRIIQKTKKLKGVIDKYEKLYRDSVDRKVKRAYVYDSKFIY